MPNEIEVEFEDARLGIRLRIKGTPEVVDEYIAKHGYSDAIKAAVHRTPDQISLTGSTDISLLNAQPLIGASKLYSSIGANQDLPEKPKADSLTQYILAIMYTPWGSRGRTSTELVNVAIAHGIGLSSSTLSGILNSIIQTGRLRRSKVPGESQWRYYPPTSIATRQP